jgi:hypothetical protein
MQKIFWEKKSFKSEIASSSLFDVNLNMMIKSNQTYEACSMHEDGEESIQNFGLKS